MLNLVLMMIERVGLIVILGFLLSHIKTFRRLLHRQDGYVDKLKLICIFSVFTIVSNYTGIEIAGNTIMNENWLQGVLHQVPLRIHVLWVWVLVVYLVDQS